MADSLQDDGPEITTGMKYALSNKFYIDVIHECVECVDAGEIDDDCPDCEGEGVFQMQHAVPWTTCKEIYKAFKKLEK